MTDKEFEKLVKQYFSEISSNMQNIEIETSHNIGLNYYKKENDKKGFERSFKNIFSLAVFISLSTNEKVVYPIKGIFTCWNCGQNVKLLFDGKKIYEEEVLSCFNDRVYSFDIQVPSGKLLLNDWIAYGNEIFGEQNENVNYLIGKYNQSKNYAKFNCLHMFVGNTCPKVMQNGNTIYIENPGYIEETDEEVFTDKSFVKKGYICTDLWWTTGIDLEYYYGLLNFTFGKDMRRNKNVRDTINNGVVLNVEPGKYRCTSYYDTFDEDNYEEPQIFIKIEKI